VVAQTCQQFSSDSLYVTFEQGHCFFSLAQGAEVQKFAMVTVGFCKTRGHQEMKPDILFGLEMDVLEDR
jgi:hypothetical protein